MYIYTHIYIYINMQQCYTVFSNVLFWHLRLAHWTSPSGQDSGKPNKISAPGSWNAKGEGVANLCQHMSFTICSKCSNSSCTCPFSQLRLKTQWLLNIIGMTAMELTGFHGTAEPFRSYFCLICLAILMHPSTFELELVRSALKSFLTVSDSSKKMLEESMVRAFHPI